MKRVEVKSGDLSITVEGFDDPAEVMAAISSCLRSLRNEQARAANDAEPVGWGHVPDQGGVAASPVEVSTSAEMNRLSHSELPSNGGETSDDGRLALLANDDAAGHGSPPSPIDEVMLQRILDWTNQQLATPEALGRREAMASLKAVVAMSNAERRRETIRNRDSDDTEAARPHRRDMSLASDPDSKPSGEPRAAR